MFEPFIEDDVPFDEYCQCMEKDGTWAGHMELQAASLVTHSNMCIHRVRPFSSPFAIIISSYPSGSHDWVSARVSPSFFLFDK